GFSYYPNPTTDILNLTSLETIEDVVIYNLLGQQVISQDVNTTSLQLDTSSLSTGAYLMRVTVNGQVGTYKVIKR
ncbi:MAG: T9SS type A sorting domain-containing protein, partial [Bacteroidia bacterium]|nr:T9SS type A sorting domain-containing protein [Bacteroidia bacterium]